MHSIRSTHSKPEMKKNNSAKTVLLSSISTLALLAQTMCPALAQMASMPNDPLFVSGQQWSLPLMHIPSAWQKASGRGVKVAILADGVDGRTPDLLGKVTQAGSNRIVGQFGYGTNMAMLIAGIANNGYGGTGIAPDASILDVQILKGTPMPDPAAILEGIQLAQQNGARIIVLAFNTEFFNEFSTQTEYNAVNNALKDFHDNHNGLVFMSGGDNHRRNNSAQRLDHINVVSGFNQMLSLGNSNTGSIITMSANQTGPGWYEDPNGFALNSTMYAAAEAAGVAALLCSYNPSLSNLQIERALLDSCFNGTAPTSANPHPWNPNYGYGFPLADLAINSLPAPTPLWSAKVKKPPVLPENYKYKYTTPTLILH